MFESEANWTTEAKDQLPAEALARFAESRAFVSARSVLPWSEHCTECAIPQCYTTCEFYSPRDDKRCRRFVDGMVRIPGIEGINDYLLKIRFKKWGKLWTHGNVRLFERDEAARLERDDRRRSTMLRWLPVGRTQRLEYRRRRYWDKKRWAQSLATAPTAGGPSYFMVECFNGEPVPVNLTLTIRSEDTAALMAYQRLIVMKPGFERVRIDYREIARRVDLAQPFTIDLTPNDVDQPVTLYFGVVDFVTDPGYQPAVAPQPKCKCVIWDLDNTLWDGILIEDGLEKLTLKPGIRDIVLELDRRGILQSVASKNNADDAMRALEHFGLTEYFLYPEISWGPKGDAVRNVAKNLNIGLDTCLFVDDSDFERAQVRSMCPDVEVVDAREYAALLQATRCDVPISEESAGRRLLYQAESRRRDVQASAGGEYFQFLRECGITLRIRNLTAEGVVRAHELAQRTNQMNFSGTRYDQQAIRDLVGRPDARALVLECEDRFGSYGTVGFAVVTFDAEGAMISDLMFSCRIQSKRVEHAFLTHALMTLIGETGRDVRARYRKTPRNAPSGKVFDDFGFTLLEERDGASILGFARQAEILDNRIVTVVAD